MNDALDPRRGNHTEPKIGSERNFGIVFAAVFVTIALWPLIRAEKAHLWLLPIAIIFLAAAFLAPRTLAPLNRLWFRIGILLGKVVTPLVMGVLWLAVLTPIGLLMRLFGRDPLRLKRQPAAKSYWIERSPPGPIAGSLKNQF
jgi:predicted membrane metal-binding protein